MIAFLIFLITVGVLGGIVVIYSIIYPRTLYIRLIHSINLFVLLVTIGVAHLYNKEFSKRDLLKTDEEEI